MKRSLLIKDIDAIKNIYLKAFVEAIISTIGLLIAVFIIYSFMKTPLPNLLTFGLGAFVSFYLVKLILFRILQKPKTK
jgi:ABC-type transport system involved in cytochrome bd biosynthesis fused ATPase/permease subunit